MEQTDIDALLNAGSGKGMTKKSKISPSTAKPAVDAPATDKAVAMAQSAQDAHAEISAQDFVAPTPAPPAAQPVVAAPPPPQPTTAPKGSGNPQEPQADPDAKLITEIHGVTSVTERETNKVMDKLDMIGQQIDRQRALITEMMGHESAQNPTIQASIEQIMAAGSEIQNQVWEAMDLMQFQDITRQKLERIIHHLRQIHDYIVDLLGSGFKHEAQAVSLSRTIAQTGTTPDENKSHADSVVDDFLRAKNKD
jgi:chemotaxis regulatin CheY-phosphate phosphatase CheZ